MRNFRILGLEPSKKLPYHSLNEERLLVSESPRCPETYIQTFYKNPKAQLNKEN